MLFTAILSAAQSYTISVWQRTAKENSFVYAVLQFEITEWVHYNKKTLPIFLICFHKLISIPAHSFFLQVRQ